MTEREPNRQRLGSGPMRERLREEKLISVARFKLDRLVRFGRLVAFLEQAVKTGLPVLGVMLLFAAVSLIGVWQSSLFNELPFLRLFLWFGFIGLLGWSIWHVRISFRNPGSSQVLRRLEEEAGLSSFELDGLQDSLSKTGDKGTGGDVQAYFWRKHQITLARKSLDLHFLKPFIPFHQIDKFSLHAPLGLLLVVGLIITEGEDRLGALSNAFTIPRQVNVESMKVDAWINPPAYTNVPPLYLRQEKQAALAGAPEGLQQFTITRVPEGSRLVIQVSKGNENTALKVTGASGESEEFPLQTMGDGLVGLEMDLVQGAFDLKLHHFGEELARWQLNAVEDRIPVVETVEATRKTVKQVLRFSYAARDDYGLVKVQAVLTPLDDQDRVDEKREPLSLDLPMPSAHPKELEQVSFQDLRAHPWAGTKVHIHLEAIDDREQVGRTEPVDIILPQRHFQDPLSRSVIEERRRLAANAYKAMLVAEVLDALTFKPEIYLKDVSAYLGLRSAFWRLDREMSGAVDDALLMLLWDIAIHRDGGELAMAEQRVRELQNQLKDALANGASDDEIERLMDALEEALSQMMKAMASRMSELQDQTMTAPSMGGQQQTGNFYRPEDLMEMLQNARELNRAGARSSAQDMLSRLENILENMNVSGGEQVFSSTRLEQMMNDLNGVSQDQQGIMDETQQLENRMDQEFQDMMGRKFREGSANPFANPNRDAMVEPDADMAEQGLSGQSEGEGTSSGKGKAPGAGEGSLGQALQGAADRQGDILEKLQQLMGQLQKESGLPMPDALEDAAEGMEESAEALKRGNPQEAQKAQSKVMDSLAQGMQEFLNNMMSNAEGASGSSGGFDQLGQQGVDPLGRPIDQNGKKGGGSNSFDTRSDLSRAQKIFEELQRRASDRSRTREELDYLDRLMKRF